jgi:predicted NBD/HSP70 family sugar kinase
MELFISEDGIVRRIRGRIASGEESMVVELLGENEELGIGTIIEAALRGDQMASDGLAHAGTYLSLCVDHIIKTYDPRLIVLSCDWIEVFPRSTNRWRTAYSPALAWSTETT